MKGRTVFATPRSENTSRKVCSTTLRTPVLGLLAAITATMLVITPARGTVIVGYTREEVLRELGVPDSTAKVGTIESLIYKNGTCITLENGKVEEIKVRGQIRLGKVVTETSGSIAPGPAARVFPNVPTPNRSVARPSVPNNPSPASTSSNVVAQLETTDEAAGAEVSEEQIKPKAAPLPLASFQPTQFDNMMARVRSTIAALAFVLVLSVVVAHFFISYCFKLICEKADETPGTLVWIPLAQFIPLLRAASMPVWLIALLLVPLVNVAFVFVLWARICIALKKSPWLAASLLIPVVNLAFIPFLAFSRRPQEEPDPTAQSWPTATPPRGTPAKSHPLSDPDASFPVNPSGVSGNQAAA